MAYLNENTPPIYCQIRREYLYDLKKHHGEVQDAIIFGLSAISGRAILFHAIMENGAVFIVYRYLRLYRKVLTQRTFLSVDWTNWSYGILLVIILLLLIGAF
jgi:hypothetical protein